MSLMVRVLRYLFYLFALLTALLLVLLGTEFGSKMTLSMTNVVMKERLHIERIDGVLLRDFELSGIVFSRSAQSITVEQMRIRWRPWQLLKRELQIRALELSHLQIEMTTQDQSDGQAGFDFDTYKLPGRLRLDRFYLQHASININESKLVLDEVNARARWEQDEIRLSHLFINHERGTARLVGRLNSSASYSLSAQLHVETFHEDIGSVIADLEISGDLLETLQFNARTSGQVALQAQGQFSNIVTGQPQWQVESTVRAHELEFFAPYTDSIALQFKGEGGLDFAYGELLVSSVLDDYGLVTFETKGRFEETQAQLESLELLASELGLEFNLVGTGDVSSDRVRAEMNGDLNYQQLPVIDIAIDWDGTPTAVEDLEMTLLSELGSLVLNGSADWAEQLTWDLRLKTQDLDLQKLVTPLQSYLTSLPEQWGSALSISGDLTTKGTLGTNRNTSFTVNSESLTLRSGAREIETLIALSYADNELEVREVSARAAQSRIDLFGTIRNEQLNLSSEIYSADLSEFHSDLQGRLNLDLDLMGPLSAPAIEIEAQGDYLAWENYAIATLRTDLKLDMSWQQLPVGTLEALSVSGLESSIAPNETDMQPFNINLMSEQSERFELSFSLANDRIEFTSHLAGEGNAMSFNGEIQEFLVKHPDVGIWQAEIASVQWDNLSKAERSIRFNDFCLVRNTRETSICGALTWSQLDKFAELDMRNVNLNTVTPWLPETVRADGYFSVYGRYREQAGAREYEVRSDISDVRMSLPEQDVTLWFDAREVLTLAGDSNALTGQFELTADDVQGNVAAEFTIDSPFQEPMLSSSVGLRFADLQIVSIVAPQLQNVSGELLGQFELAGALRQPRMNGFIELTEGIAEVPSAGIRLEALNARIQAPENPESSFVMQANARSGGGTLDISGDYVFSSHTANFNIEGDNFEAMNTRDLRLKISPELALEVAPQSLKLRGRVFIPEARVSPPEFDTVVRSSADTVVVRNEDTVWQNTQQSPYDIDIEVNLGDQFNVAAYGFEGRLNGGLRIIEQPNQQTTAVGNINVAAGQYELYGQQLTVERGTLVYSGGVISNPGLDLRVSRQFELEQVNVGARVGGTLRAPRLTLFSTPTMQDAEILSYLVLGRGFSEESTEDQNLFLQASLALGMQGGNILGERLSDTLGVDEIVLDGGDTLESTALYIGKQLSPRLYVRYGVGLVEPVSTFFIRYRLNDYLNFETQTGTLGSGADLFYTIER
ncbi:MAG: autotransporter translocation and assembly module inner membrane component TamB [Idiomarinaceae bacterium HL-53]|nr:MAG: autotransporter translocation and assembly module inner membrane component TamB [Idiomarinaceae bacterium HL-53]CUS47884.1 Autotransporter translocation and assembly factor TamB [Idiomarinaceae bacterium HL-53]